jgi:hypothetical protein
MVLFFHVPLVTIAVKVFIWFKMKSGLRYLTKTARQTSVASKELFEIKICIKLQFID